MIQCKKTLQEKNMKKKIVIICLIIAVVIGAAAGGFLIAMKKSPEFKNEVKLALLKVFPNAKHVCYYYVDGKPQHDMSVIDLENCDSDVKEIQKSREKTYVINHARGYALEFGPDAEFDFTTDGEFFTVIQKDMKITVSKEYSPYEREQLKAEYIDKSLNEFFVNERFAEHNKITIHKDNMERIGDYWMQVSAISRQPAPGSEIELNTYVQCIIYKDDRTYYRILFKGKEYDDYLIDQVYKTLYSFTEEVDMVGTTGVYTDFKPIENPNWSDETKKLYEEIKNSPKVKWGLYSPWSVIDNDFEKIEEVEEKLDYNFDGTIEYLYLGQDLPVEGMKTAHKDGKIIELTLQTSTVMNLDLDSHNIMFDIIDGLKDLEIRTLACDIRDFGHPILFRLNNEMNSDWTTYGGNITLNDPEIFVQVWRRFYDIFEQEGVNNAIWIFNPNDHSFPPCGFNSSIAYYPGNEYVHMFGVTGYNTGTYYAEKYMEKWREFEEIYDDITKTSEKIYGEFPWVITEFASSSVGGDKAQWIDNMFASLHKFPKIKMAFWFSSADYDADNNNAVARPYWIDENEDSINAFKNNLKNY